MDTRPPRSSWQNVSRWYDTSLGSSGDRTHAEIVIPKTVGLLSLRRGDSVLDLACGQGILARHMPDGIGYVGIDAAPSLIAAAKQRTTNHSHRFLVGDITKPYNLDMRPNRIACILALDNIEQPDAAIRIAANYLVDGGLFVLVVNHPCFRIPRQSSWETDPENKIQYRRINRYLSPLRIPISMHPGSGGGSPVTWTFHRPLYAVTGFLTDNGFCINAVEEWVSGKRSVGSAASMENRARAEFPLFLAIRAVKLPTAPPGAASASRQ